MNTRSTPRSAARCRFAGVVLVALAALLPICSSALADTNDAAARARTPKNLFVQAYAGPFRFLVGSTVTVTDPVSGATMATAKTLRHGEVRLRVAGEPSTAAPFVVTVTGGRVRGRAFVGKLSTIVSELGPLVFKRVDLATTAAAKMPLARTGGFDRHLASVRRALGFVRADDDQTLQYYSYAVGDQQLLRAVTRAGGYDAFTSMLARTAQRGGRVKGLRTRVLQLPHPKYKQRKRPTHRKPTKGTTARSAAPSTRQSSSSGLSSSYTANAASAPCYATYSPPASKSNAGETAATDFAIESAAGLLTVMASGNPLSGSPAITSGIVGLAVTSANALENPPSSTNPVNQQLNVISDQLDCISNQILALQSSVTALGLEITVSDTVNCQSSIESTWATYQGLVQTAADSSAADDQLTSANSSLTALMSNGLQNIPAMQQTCNNVINNALFEQGVGMVPAWPGYLSQLQSGQVGLLPSAVQSLQVFLSQYATLEYQQMAMVSEYYNYQALYGSGAQWTNEQSQMGVSGNCPQTPSVANVSQTATTFCQMLQNISDVYPGSTYTDEAGVFTTAASSCGSPCSAPSNAVSGYAVSAIPGSFGEYSTAGSLPSPVTGINQMNPSALASMCNSTNESEWPCTSGWGASTWSQALAEYNTLPTGKLAAPYETWSTPQVDKTAVLCSSCGYNMAALSGFFNSQLNATPNVATTTTIYYQPQTVTQCTQSGTCSVSCPTNPTPGTTQCTLTTTSGVSLGSSSTAWQLVGSGSGLTNYQTTNSECQVVAQQTFYSPSPWLAGDGYTITPNPTVNGADNFKCTNWYPTISSVFPTSPSVAVLVSRPWNQGQTWPAAPAVTTSSATSGGQLAAKNCPSSGCTWGYTGTLPTGWTLSASGLLSVVCGSPAATITVIAGNNFSFGNATVTVTPPTSGCPVVTTTSISTPGSSSAYQLAASNCGSKGCTWLPSGTLPSGWSVTSSGAASGPCSTSGTVSIMVIAASQTTGLISTPQVVTFGKCQAPAVTSTTITAAINGNDGQLTGSNCGSGCTWVCATASGVCVNDTAQTENTIQSQPVVLLSDGTLICNPYSEGYSGTISVTATNPPGLKSPATTVTVNCSFASPTYDPTTLSSY